MSRLEESPYATLEVPRTATHEQIEAAYSKLRDLLADGQLAAYGMLDAGEANRQREQLEMAYEVLRDQERRRAYDHAYDSGQGDAAADHQRFVGHVTRSAPPRATANAYVGVRQGRRTLQTPLLSEIPNDATFDGPLLRRLRESAGATIEDFSEWTKISRRYLKAIEANDYGLLPAPVYVRGFVGEYARILGMQAKAVADSYLEGHRRWRARR